MWPQVSSLSPERLTKRILASMSSAGEILQKSFIVFPFKVMRESADTSRLNAVEIITISILIIIVITITIITTTTMIILMMMMILIIMIMIKK